MTINTDTLFTRIRCQAQDLARSSTELARRVGPTRGLVGLGLVAGAVTGTIVLVRYLRARADEQALAGEDQGTLEDTQGLEDPTTTSGRRHRRLSRARRRAMSAYTASH